MDIGQLSAATRYETARNLTEPTSGGDAAPSVLSATFQSFEATLKESEALSKHAMLGNSDPHALVQALAQTELAVETAVTFRNRVVEAYQEILRMPV